MPPRVTAEDRNAHRAFVHTLGGAAVWLDYWSTSNEAVAFAA
jgi:hypothetical protein